MSRTTEDMQEMMHRLGKGQINPNKWLRLGEYRIGWDEKDKIQRIVDIMLMEQAYCKEEIKRLVEKNNEIIGGTTNENKETNDQAK